MSFENKIQVAISLSHKQKEFGILLKARIIQECFLGKQEVFMHYSDDTQDEAISNDPETYFYKIFQDCKLIVLLLSEDYPLPNKDGNQYCIDEFRGAFSNVNEINGSKVILPYFFHSKEIVIRNFKLYNEDIWNKFGKTIIASTLVSDWQKDKFECTDCQFKDSICEKENGYCRSQQIDRMTNLIQKKLKETNSVIKKDLMKLDFNLENKNDIKIKETKTYEAILRELDKFEKGLRTQLFHLSRDNFYNAIKKLIQEQNLIFIEGALLTGKSTTMYQFSIAYQNDFTFVFSDPTSLSHKTKFHNKKDVYFQWLKQVLSDFKIKNSNQISKNPLYKKLNNLNDLYISKIENYQFFLEELQKNKEFIETNELASFLRIINKCRFIYNNDSTLVLAIHLDDFHKYADKDVFDQIREDLIDYRNNSDLIDYDSLKIKLIIITRYFPSIKPKHNVIPIEDLCIEDIRVLFSPILTIDLPDEALHEKFIEEIYNSTKGHAWFVFRIIRAYLKLRTRSCRFNPIELVRYIIQDSNIWFNNDNLYSEKELGNSEYIKELRLITEEFPQYRDSFYQFLAGVGTQIRVNDEKYRNNPILRQSGLIRNIKSEHFEKYTNKIIDLHFTKKNLTNNMI